MMVTPIPGMATEAHEVAFAVLVRKGRVLLCLLEWRREESGDSGREEGRERGGCTGNKGRRKRGVECAVGHMGLVLPRCPCPSLALTPQVSL